ncbi:MAG: hypothetical protein L6Q97_26165, partial [Thermoanaerobaculia bacterium]|nr:hypothetical protein [Thermoanaerobaculia bacterium]
MKNACTPHRAFKNSTLCLWALLFINLVAGSAGQSQTALSGQLRYSANGTGRTTGRIATLHIYNPT